MAFKIFSSEVRVFHEDMDTLLFKVEGLVKCETEIDLDNNEGSLFLQFDGLPEGFLEGLREQNLHLQPLFIEIKSSGTDTILGDVWDIRSNIKKAHWDGTYDTIATMYSMSGENTQMVFSFFPFMGVNGEKVINYTQVSRKREPQWREV